MSQALSRSDEGMVEAARERVVRALRRRVETEADAQDIAQEVMIRMERRSGLPREEWTKLLSVVTAHELARYYARRLRAIPLDRLSPEQLTLVHAADPERQAIDRAEARWAIGRAIAASKTDAEAMVRHDVYDIPFEEQARTQGRSEGALQRGASRARQRLKRMGRWAALPPGGVGSVGARRLGRWVVRKTTTVIAAGTVAGAGLIGPGATAIHAHDLAVAARTSASASTPTPLQTTAPRRVSDRTWPPHAERQASRPTPLASPQPQPKVATMHTVVGAHVGNPSTVSAGASVQRNNDRRSPIQQTFDCLTEGPSLDPQRFGCPS